MIVTGLAGDNIRERLKIESECRVCRSRAEDGRLEQQKVSERLGFISGRRLDRRQALTILGHSHHYVAQKCGLRGGGTQVCAGCGSLHGCKLMLHLRRPGCRTSADLGDRRVQRGGVSPLGCDPAQFQQGGQIVRLRGQNLLQKLLHFRRPVFIALPFRFFRQAVDGPQVFRIQLRRFAQVGNRLGGLAALALQDSQQIIDAIILRGQVARPSEPLRRQVVISLPQGKDSPVGPPGGLAGDKLRHLREPAVRVHIIANLQRRQADIESRNHIGVFLGGPVGKFGGGMTSGSGGEHGRQKKKQKSIPAAHVFPVAVGAERNPVQLKNSSGRRRSFSIRFSRLQTRSRLFRTRQLCNSLTRGFSAAC